MADLIELVRGTPPWKPHPDAKLVETFNVYDIPLVGIVAEPRVGSHLFQCLEGHVRDWNVWAYAHVDDFAVHELERAASGDRDTFFKCTADLFADQRYVVALSHIPDGIVRVATIDNPEDYDSPLAAAVDHLRLSREELADVGIGTAA
jgi:hypothetical protein